MARPKKNATEVGVSTQVKESITADYFDYSHVTNMLIDLLENDYISAKLSSNERGFLFKNYQIPIKTKGGRLLVKLINPSRAGSYEVGLKEGNINEFDGIRTRPKVISYLKYKQGEYFPVTPRELIEFYLSKKPNPTNQDIDHWQSQLDSFTFLHF
jgi:hypothetical protein